MDSNRPTLSSVFVFAIATTAIGAQQLTVSPNINPLFAFQRSQQVVFAGDFRYQHFDNSHVGTPMLIRGIAIRRDASLETPASPERSMELTVRASEIDMTRLNIEFEQNLFGATTVFSPKRIVMPEWDGSAGVQEPFDFIIHFDQPFAYSGTGAILFDLLATHNTSDIAAIAAALSYPAAISEPNYFSDGCPRPNGGSFFLLNYLENSGPNMPNLGMRYTTRIYNGEPLHPVFLLLGFSDPNALLPGMCAPLRVDPLRVNYLGEVNADGHMDFQWFSFPHSFAFQDVTFYAQALQLISSSPTPLPFILSNAIANTMPAVASGGIEFASSSTCVAVDGPTAFGEVNWGRALLVKLLL